MDFKRLVKVTIWAWARATGKIHTTAEHEGRCFGRITIHGHVKDTHTAIWRKVTFHGSVRPTPILSFEQNGIEL